MTVTQQTTLNEFFMQQKGIFIFMQQNQPGFDTEKWLSSWVAENSAHVISINGLKGAVQGIVTGNGVDGQPVQVPADLVFIKENRIIEIRGMVSEDQLIRIAETL
jgi:hypothetical protein